MLLLKRHLVELVKAGKKRQTIRLWSRPLLRAGQISYTPGLGKMLITAIEQLPSLAALSEADALADGFPNLKELLAEIHRIYGHAIPPGKSIYRIQFEWPHLPNPAAPAPSHIAAGLPAETRSPPKNARQIVKSLNRRVVKSSRPIAAIAAAKPRIRAGMTKSQRQKLRAHILARAPASK